MRMLTLQSCKESLEVDMTELHGFRKRYRGSRNDARGTVERRRWVRTKLKKRVEMDGPFLRMKEVAMFTELTRLR